MAGRIPQNFIDDLVSRADIVEVINARVPLKKKGKEYTACCPFHNEKTPSFTVSDSKQFYHCFGCGAHGTALGFLMEYENLDFVDAVEALAAEYNLDNSRLTFLFSATDDLDNVSTKVQGDNLFQVYQGDLPPLETPRNLSAVAKPGGQVELSWREVTDAAAYQLYRQSTDETGLTEYQRLTDVTYTDTTTYTSATS